MLKSAFLFPGQSSQRTGMLKELYTENESVRQTFEEASDLLNMDVPRLCFAGDDADLRDIRISAPLIVTAGVACFRHFALQSDLPPSLLAGHSLGEYTALSCAGAMTLPQVLPAVRLRSELALRAAQEKQGIMCVIYRTNSAQIEEWCAELRREGKQVWACCLNAPDQLSVGGTQKDVETLERLAASRGASVKRIVGNAPFHTPLMTEAAAEFEAYLGTLSLSAPLYPVISNVDLQCYSRDTIIPKLVRQLTRPVQWNRTLEYIHKQNTECYIELGSGQILTRLVQARLPEANVFAYEYRESRARLNEYLRAEKPVTV